MKHIFFSAWQTLSAYQFSNGEMPFRPATMTARNPDNSGFLRLLRHGKA